MSKQLLDRIVARGAEMYKLTPEAIVGPFRHHYVTEVRFMVCATAYAAGMGYSEIGRYFDRHHTTIIEACRKACCWIDQSTSYRNIFEELYDATNLLKGPKYAHIPDPYKAPLQRLRTTFPALPGGPRVEQPKARWNRAKRPVQGV